MPFYNALCTATGQMTVYNRWPAIFEPDTRGNPGIAQIRQNDPKSAKTDLEGVPVSSHLKHRDYWFILPNCAVSKDLD
jgi:hypothetical protein